MGSPSTPRPPAEFRPDQRALIAWFNRLSPELAELYKGAVITLNDRNFPGRVRFIAHAGREIGNRLPGLVCEDVSSTQVNYKGEIDDITSAWLQEEHSLSLPAAPPVQSTVAEPDPNAIPRISPLLYVKIQGLIKKHQEGRKRPIEKAQSLVEALAPENVGRQDALRPMAQHIAELTRWFAARAHLPHGAQPVDEEELQGKFRVLEDAITALVGTFYETVEELDEILEDTNR